MPDEFFSKLIANYLAEITGKAGATIGKTLTDLWQKRGSAPTPSANLPAPFNAPPPLPLALQEPMCYNTPKPRLTNQITTPGYL